MKLGVHVDFCRTLGQALEAWQRGDAFGSQVFGDGLVDAGKAVGIWLLEVGGDFVEVFEGESTAFGQAENIAFDICCRMGSTLRRGDFGEDEADNIRFVELGLIGEVCLDAAAGEAVHPDALDKDAGVLADGSIDLGSFFTILAGNHRVDEGAVWLGVGDGVDMHGNSPGGKGRGAEKNKCCCGQGQVTDP